MHKVLCVHAYVSLMRADWLSAKLRQKQKAFYFLKELQLPSPIPPPRRAARDTSTCSYRSAHFHPIPESHFSCIPKEGKKIHLRMISLPLLNKRSPHIPSKTLPVHKRSQKSCHGMQVESAQGCANTQSTFQLNTGLKESPSKPANAEPPPIKSPLHHLQSRAQVR